MCVQGRWLTFFWAHRIYTLYLYISDLGIEGTLVLSVSVPGHCLSGDIQVINVNIVDIK